MAMDSRLIPLSKNFYLKEDVVKIAQELLGKVLCTKICNELTTGMIVETEAYKGTTDRACHAYGHRKTKRNASMYEQGGVSYVYLCYGLHTLFNVVTNSKNVPHAVLIRAIQPLDGVEHMLKRRGKKNLEKSLTAGPGSLCRALDITTKMNGLSLFSSSLWIAEYKKFTRDEIIQSPRIGIDYAKEDAKLPWRFRVKNNPWTSPAKK